VKDRGTEGPTAGRERIDRALVRDVAHALRSPAAWLFIVVIGAAAVVQVVRGGPERLPLLLIITGGCLAYGVVAWFAGRDPTAHPAPDRVPRPRAELAAILVGYVALVLVMFRFGAPAATLFVAGLAAWVLVVVRAGIRPADLGSLLRGWRPFTALLIAAALPKLLFLGPSLLGGLPLALPSGIFQQVALQVGLTDRLEAVLRSPGAGAVAAALLFGFAHTPIDLAKADGDVLLALSSAVCLQAQIGLVFCIAHIRHRAPVALGVAHAIVIA
jgi:hypothetical protein